MFTGRRYLSSAGSASSMVSYEFIEDVSSVPAVIEELRRSSYLSVDCEGVRLGRDGKLCLMQIATASKVYIFDIVKLKHVVFDSGLKGMLEDETLPKYFFDCRGDCNALLYQFDIDVKGMQDLQILDLLMRRMLSRKCEFVNGLGRSMSHELPGCGFSKFEKDQMHRRFEANDEFWLARPLDAQSLKYAATDVFYLPQLRQALLTKTSILSAKIVDLLKYASERYADHVRRNDRYVEGGKYVRNARFPLNILPKVGPGGTFQPFPQIMPRRCSDCGVGCQQSDMCRFNSNQCVRCRKIDIYK